MSLYLGGQPEGITGHDRCLLKILTAGAKKAIACKWLQTDTPTGGDWLEIIEEIQEMERLPIKTDKHCKIVKMEIIFDIFNFCYLDVLLLLFFFFFFGQKILKNCKR